MHTKVKIRRLILAGLGLIAASLLTALATAPAHADFGIVQFDGATVDRNGDPFTQAGGHPGVSQTKLWMNEMPNPGAPFPPTLPDGKPKDIVVDVPEGIVGDTTAPPAACSMADLVATSYGEDCPQDATVGTLGLKFTYLPFAVHAPMFILPAQPGDVARFGTSVGGVAIGLSAELNPDGYGLRMASMGTPQQFVISAYEPFFQGIPADHNPLISERKPFLTMPTSCTGPLEYNLRVNSWDDPDTELPDSFTTPAQTGCENVPFTPTVNAQPTSTRADSPTGLAVDISIPDDGIKNPDGISQSHLKDVVMTFPEGMAVNPAAADGLGACPEEKIALGQAAAADCPPSSKIGTVEMTTPVLSETLKGAVYQAEQDNNPFDSTLAIYINAINEQRGIDIKLAGEISTDPGTGRLTATFKDNPQLPLENMRLTFKSGSRAPLVTPPTCGSYDIVTELTPWARPSEVVTKTSSFTIDKGPNGGPCKAGDPGLPGSSADLASRPFNPQMKAGVTSPVAGSTTPFTFRLTRDDGDQEILSTTVTPPQGLTAKLAGIPLCNDAQASQGNCPASSQIGEVIAGAGAGPTPFYIQGENAGKVFMTDAYKGEQLGMLIQVPAKAGPFDLGTVNVRTAVAVDKRTAQLTVKSDPIPQILEGIPLRTRDIRVSINRDDFTIAPTNCDPMQVSAQATGVNGATANLTNRFQVGDCSSLGFSPELNLSFGKAKKNTKPNSHPPLQAKLAFNEGDANIAGVEVALPQGLLLDQDRLGRICSRANYAANTCPAESRVGYAKATTPLLDEPVEGPVYLKASDNPLPDLAADLNGQIDIDLFGKIDQKTNKKGLNQIRNTFDVVPDVPVSDFELKLDGGSDGLLVNSRNICKSTKAQKVSIDMQAHNGMTMSSKPLIGSACKQINQKKVKKLKKKAKKLLAKAKKTSDRTKAKSLRKQARKLKRQANKLGR